MGQNIQYSVDLPNTQAYKVFLLEKKHLSTTIFFANAVFGPSLSTKYHSTQHLKLKPYTYALHTFTYTSNRATTD
jgi:hypothetical protein